MIDCSKVENYFAEKRRMLRSSRTEYANLNVQVAP